MAGMYTHGGNVYAVIDSEGQNHSPYMPTNSDTFRAKVIVVSQLEGRLISIRGVQASRVVAAEGQHYHIMHLKFHC